MILEIVFCINLRHISIYDICNIYIYFSLVCRLCFNKMPLLEVYV